MPQMMTDWHAMETRAKAKLDKAVARLAAAQKEVELAAMELGAVQALSIRCSKCNRTAAEIDAEVTGRWATADFSECPRCDPDGLSATPTGRHASVAKAVR